METNALSPRSGCNWEQPNARVTQLFGETAHQNVVALGDGAMWACVPPTAGLKIEVIEGALWITQAGESTDVALLAGEVLSLNGDGKVVAEAIGETRGETALFRIVEGI